MEELITAKKMELHGWASNSESEVFAYKRDGMELEVVAELVKNVESLEEKRTVAGESNSNELMV